MDKNPPRRSRKVSCLITRTSSTQQEQETRRWMKIHKVACQCLQKLKKKIKQVRRDRIGGSRRGAQNWFQSIRIVTRSCERSITFPSWRACQKGSKVILIEKLFKPTCSRITSTTHSATIRKRWCANWAMWSYSSCAKQHQKCNVLIVFFIGIKEMCTALADNSWLTPNPEESLTI